MYKSLLEEIKVSSALFFPFIMKSIDCESFNLKL